LFSQILLARLHRTSHQTGIVVCDIATFVAIKLEAVAEKADRTDKNELGRTSVVDILGLGKRAAIGRV